jgi:hypothetical protein
VSELREGIDQALRTVIPGEPPVGKVLRRGKAIRVRRRLTALASVAAVALLAGFGYPALSTHHAAPAPGPAARKSAPAPAPRKPVTITDVPPGPQASSSLIAVGTVSGADWKIAAGVLGANTPPGQQCFAAYGRAFEAGSTPLCDALAEPDALTPVEFTEFVQGPGPNAVVIGRVAGDVQYVTVTLADSITLKLIPVAVSGTRYVAFPIPRALAIDSASAHLRDGDYLTAVPFMAPDRLPNFGMWLQPGQRGQAPATKLIASAPPGSQAWAFFVAVGPWGICEYSSPNMSIGCLGTQGPLGTAVQGFMGAPRVYWGSASLAVSYVRLTLTDGKTVRLNVVRVGNEKYFAFVLGNGQVLRQWTAYDAAGRQVATGTK